MRFWAIILCIIIFKAGLATGLCAESCTDPSSTSCTIEMTSHGDTHESSDHNTAPNSDCQCFCCHIQYCTATLKSEEKSTSHLDVEPFEGFEFWYNENSANIWHPPQLI